MIMSVVANAVCFVAVSLATRPSLSERLQSASLSEHRCLKAKTSACTKVELPWLSWNACLALCWPHSVKVAFQAYWSQQREGVVTEPTSAVFVDSSH